MPPHRTGAFTKPISRGRSPAGAGWLVAIVPVAASAITNWGAERHSPEPAAVTLAESLCFLEVLLCALLIDLCHRRRRVAYNHVRQDSQDIDIRIVHSRRSLRCAILARRSTTDTHRLRPLFHEDVPAGRGGMSMARCTHMIRIG